MSESDLPTKAPHQSMSPVHIVLLAIKRIFTQVLRPIAVDLWRVLYAMLRPLLQVVARGTTESVRNLHNKKHWLHRSGATFWGNAVGLCIAMISAQLLTHFIEVRSLENLWGLFSKRTVISADSFKILSFVVEFLITLFVFSALEFFMDSRAIRKQADLEQGENTDDD